MRKIISFSLWGDSRLYNQGALDNIDACERYYPDWTPRFYVAKNCPVLADLLSEENRDRCEVSIMPATDYVKGSTVNVEQHHNPIHRNMLWRNLALFDSDIVLLRDTDSLVSPREAEAVSRWLDSGEPACALYDHPAHVGGILMPGLTGYHGSIARQLYGTETLFRQVEDAYYDHYITGKIGQGLALVHYDIWVNWHLLICKIGLDRVWRAGYNQPHTLTVPMPEDGTLGAHLGATVHEERRFETY